MSKGKVVVIGSNANRIETKGGYWGDTGNYLNETVVPMMALIEAGYEPVLATPNGTPPTIDKASDAPAHFGGDVHAYEHAIVHTIVPLGNEAEISGFPRDAIAQIEAMSFEERLDVFSKKTSTFNSAEAASSD